MMMDRKAGLLIVTTLCLGAAVAAASTLGLARAKGDYSVQRAAKSLSALADSPFVLNAGDVVKAARQFVRIQGTSGHAILVGRGSSVRLPDQKTVQLQQGEMAVSLPPSSPVEAQVQDLIIVPQAATGSTTPPSAGTLAMGNKGPGDVALIAQGSAFRVLSLPDRSQVAVVNASEALRLVKDSAGAWIPRPLMQDEPQGDPSDDSNTGEEKAGVLGLFGAGGGGGGSTALIVAGGVVGAGVVTVGTVEGIQAIEEANQQEKKDEPSPTPTATPTPTEPPDVSKIRP